jgi:hypothetical protein
LGEPRTAARDHWHTAASRHHNATVNAVQLSRARCRALVISCSDFRFISAQRQARLDLGLENSYDLIARPGGVRQVVLPTSEAARQTMLEEIDLLRSLHHFPRILLMNHMGCGMYKDISTRTNEEAIHRSHLHQAHDILRERFPGLTVETYLSVIGPDGVEVIRLERTTGSAER